MNRAHLHVDDFVQAHYSVESRDDLHKNWSSPAMKFIMFMTGPGSEPAEGDYEPDTQAQYRDAVRRVRIGCSSATVDGAPVDFDTLAQLLGLMA